MPWGAIAGAVIGGIASNQAAKKASKSQSVQNQSPWVGAQPYLLRGFQAADNLFSGGYPTATQAAYRGRGLFGSPAQAEANRLVTDTLAGKYLNSNPFLDQSVSRAMGDTKSMVNSQFGPFNNFGSSGHQEWLGRSLLDTAMKYRAQNYENERGRQFAALSNAPALQNMDYQNLEALRQADFMPWDFLGKYQGIVSGLNPGGGTTTSQNPYFSNPVNSALGGALLGNQLYKSFQQPSYGSGDDIAFNWLGLGG